MFSRKSAVKNQLQLLGATACLIACKMDEIHPPTLVTVY
jgi:hypothetical protein